ncbi:MAG TPA: helix-turn-helix domain-containing protein [Candidatus Eremiobacteraceae bacterium]
MNAAKKFLTSREAAHGFSVDAIARRAGVTRATIYHGFKSKTGLLGELYDSFASRAALRDRIGLAFRAGDLSAALRRIVAAYCHLWAKNRLMIRRLHALADVDPGFSRAGRGEWRRSVLTALVAQHADALGRVAARKRPEVVDVLHMLTSFETFDDMARGRRGEALVVRLIAKIALRVGQS